MKSWNRLHDDSKSVSKISFNKILRIILSACWILLHANVAEAQIMFQHYFGDVQSEGARAIVQTADGGYALLGSTYSSGAGSEDIWLVKTDASGNMEWSKSYGGTDVDIGYDLRQLDNGGFVIAASTYSFGALNFEAYILNVDSAGNLNWSFTCPASGHDVFNSILVAQDGGIVAAGQRSNNVCFMKLDQCGTLQWIHELSGGGISLASSMIQTSDSGYALTGSITDAITGFTDVLVIRTDSQGDTLWTRRLGGASYDEAESIRQTADGGFVLLGQSSSFSNSGLDMYLVRMDSGGNIIWSKGYGEPGNEYGADVLVSVSGEYSILGRTLAFGAGMWDMVLLHADSSGNQLWSKNYGGSSSEYPNAMIFTGDGGYAIAGEAYGGLGQTDMIFVKTNDQGVTTCQIDSAFDQSPISTLYYGYAPSVISNPFSASPSTLSASGVGSTTALCPTGVPEENTINLDIYPNPFTDSFTIQIPNEIDFITVTIRNIVGQLITLETYSNATTIRMSPNIDPGFYIIEVALGNKIIARRLITRK